MALNSSGPISLAGSTAGQSIALELSQSATGTISLNDAAVRNLAGVPSGAITMPTNFWGKSSLTGYLATYNASSGPSTPYTFTGNIDSSGRVIMTWGNDSNYPSFISLSSTFTLASTTVPGFNPFIGSSQTPAAPQQGTNSSGRFCLGIAAAGYNSSFLGSAYTRYGLNFLNGFTYGATGTISQRTIYGNHPEPSGLNITNMNFYQSGYDQGNALNYDGTIGLANGMFFGGVIVYGPKGSYYTPSKKRNFVALYNTSGVLTNSVYLANLNSENQSMTCGFDSSNNVYTSALVYGLSGGYYTLYTKFNSALSPQWSYSNNDYAIFCGADSSGNTYWHTYTGGNGLGSVYKISSGGSVLWGKTYSGPYVDRKQFKIQNDILLGCTRDSSSIGYIVRIDISTGNITWQRRIYNNPVSVSWYYERWYYDGCPKYPINDGTNYVYPGTNGATLYLLKMPVSGAVGTGSTALGNYGTTTAFSASNYTPDWVSQSVTWSSLSFTDSAWSYASATTQSMSTGTITTF